MDSRLAEVEIKLDVVEDHLEQLNRTVYRQEQQIKGLQDQIRELHRQMLSSSAPSMVSVPSEELPPHY